MKLEKTLRRQLLKSAGVAFVAALAAWKSGWVDAATNATMRTALKYQNKPEGDRNCANCGQFVPGATPKDLGGCKILPGDTEVSPQGYCIGWVKKT